MVFGAILAGGVGSRMGNNIPKQFLLLGDKPIIIYSLEKFLSCSRMDHVFVGVSAAWLEHTQALVREYLPNDAHRIHVMEGGSGRNDTLQNIISAIEPFREGSDNDIIVTHDAVRPFVTLRMIEENIDQAIRHGAVNTVCPAVDTIVVSEDGTTISDIPNRTRMYYGHSPQSFRIDLLKQLYSTLSPEEKETLTDACKICVLRGQPVVLVQSEYTNLKITTPGDYLIAQTYIANGVDRRE